MSRQHGLFLAILVLALTLRLGIIVLRSGDLATDPDAYAAHAAMIEDGYGFAGPSTKRPTAFRPPGFSWLIAVLPGGNDDSPRNVAMINLAAGVLTVLLTRQLAEQAGLSPGLSLAAAALTAVDPLLVRYTALPMTEVLSTALITLAVLWFQVFRISVQGSPAESEASHAAPAGRMGSILSGILAGLCFAAASLVRPIALPILALVVIVMCLDALKMIKGRETSGGTSGRAGLFVRRMMFALIPCVVFAIALSPWIIRNHRCFQAFVPATTHGGYTLALGNNAEYYRDVVNGVSSEAWDGRALDAWQKKSLNDAVQQGVATDDEKALDEWMYRQAYLAMQNDPVSCVRACLLRLRRFWGVTTMAGQSFPSWASDLTGVWYAGLWVLLTASAVCGRVCRRSFETRELWATIVAFLLMHTFYWTDTRMRAPLMPVICVLACVGVMRLRVALTVQNVHADDNNHGAGRA